MKRVVMSICVLAFLGLGACKDDRISDNQIFTLYHNAPSDNAARIGIATFDMNWGEINNYNYCQKFAGFLQKEWDADSEVQELKKKNDPGVLGQRHWCEKGRYKK